MRILVTGATGFIGIEVARQLAVAGHRPRVLVRRISRAPLLSALDVEPVHGDLGSTDSLARALEGTDVVVHLAARATFERYERLRPTIVDGTGRLYEAAADAGVRHFVYASSAFVYGDGSDGIDPDTPAAPVLGYGRAKLETEGLLAAGAARGGPSVAALRLPHVYGAQSLLFGLVRKRMVVFPGAGENVFPQLHVADAARALIAAADGWTGAAPLADHHRVTWNEFFDVLTWYAPRTRIARLPARPTEAACRLTEAVLGRLGPTMLSGDTIRGWNLDLPVESKQVWEELGLEPLHPSVLSGIPATLDDAVAFRWRHPVWDWS